MIKIIATSLLVLLSAYLTACGGGGSDSVSGTQTDSESSSLASATNAADAITYYSDAKTLVDRYCVACHHSSGIAPFPMQTYAEIYSKRSAIIYSLESNTMPPSGHAEPTASETQLMLNWLDAGAPEGDPEDQPILPAGNNLSYYADVKHIIDNNCVACHTPGGLAPFPLHTYDDVRTYKAAAAYSVRNQSMPPWPPTLGHTTFLHERALGPEDKYALLSWLDSEARAGDPSEEPAAIPAAELPEPDFNMQLRMQEPYTPTLRPDDHRCFAIEWPLAEFTYVTNVDVNPDQLEEVHHVIVSVAEPEDANHYQAANGQDGSPGWYCLGAGGVSGAPLPRQIGGWVPGAGREPAPEGTGIGVRPGSIVVVQMHYNTLTAEPSPDQSQLLIETTDTVDRPARSFLLANPNWLKEGGMPIEAGDADAHHEFTFPAFALASVFGEQAGVRAFDPWVIHQGFLHMHTLGTSARTTLIRTDGTEQVLLDIQGWDFNWQGTYNFAREILVNPRDSIKLECNWDNSQENQDFVNGEQLITKYVEWGDGTQDEMCLMSVLMTQPKAGFDYSYQPSLYIEAPAHRQQFSAGDLVPLRLILNNFSLQEPGTHDHTDPDLHSGTHSDPGDDHDSVYSGHYHVYLNDAEDGDDHLTAWDESYYYKLPAELEPGLHSLRVTLRGDDHHPLGIEQTVSFEVVENPAAQQLTLIDVDSWQQQAASADPLAAHRPADDSCPDNSWYNEEGALEVETGYCKYFSVTQASLADVSSGDTLHLVLWHGDLAYEDSASAHVAITIDGNTIWESDVEIPSAADIFDVKIPVNFDAPAGSTVEYHLHNHGYNTWTLLQLEVER